MKNKTKISICQLFGHYNYGGIARVVTDLSSRLENDFQVAMLCRKAVKKPEEGLNLVELKPKNTLDLWRKLSDIGEFDVIHCHDIYALPGLVRNKGRRAKIVYTHHAIVPWRYSKIKDISGWVLAHLCGKYAIPKVDLAVGISDYTLGELRERYKCQKTVKIPDGVDIEKFCTTLEDNSFLRLKTGCPTLLFVGLLEKHKGVKFIIDSMPCILREFPEASLVLVGTGRDDKLLGEHVARMGLQERVIFPGFVEDDVLLSYYNASDIHVEASYWHGFGLPIIEAMACGKPVITRDAYAMREHIVNSGAGVLFEKDDPKELVSAVREIMGNYEEYASRARKYAENFDLNHVASEYAKAYVNILAGKGR